MNTLKLHRFNGTETFSISSANIYAWEDRGKYCLNFEIETEEALETVEDTAEMEAEPSAEITLRLDNLKVSELEGQSFEVKNALNEEIDDFVTNLYYFEHQGINNNFIIVKSVNEDQFIIDWKGTTTDINYYDGSKPEAKVEVSATFTFKDYKKWE